MENCLCNFMSSYFMRIWGGSIGMMLVLQISEVPSKHFPKAAAGCQFVDGFLQNLWKVHHTSLGGTTHLGCNWKKCRFFLPGPPQMLNKGKTNQSVLLWWQDLVLPQVNCPTRWSLYCHLDFCFDHLVGGWDLVLAHVLKPRKKLSTVEGFRPSTHYVVWVGEPD